MPSALPKARLVVTAELIILLKQCERQDLGRASRQTTSLCFPGTQHELIISFCASFANVDAEECTERTRSWLDSGIWRQNRHNRAFEGSGVHGEFQDRDEARDALEERCFRHGMSPRLGARNTRPWLMV
jgi:hypothetical protein